MDTFNVEPDVLESLRRVFVENARKNNEKDNKPVQKDSIIPPSKNFI